MAERRSGSEEGGVWDRWDEVDRLFDAALDLPAAERARFLADACGADYDLLQRVSDLLAVSETPDELLSGPRPSLVRAAWSQSGAPDLARPFQPGAYVGRYRIIAELGRGGMATVYEAERADGTFQRRVALKVIRRGVDTEDAVRRFLAERQILSGLTHPNIARLHDGGAADDGGPYLVMDYVDGQPITTFADRHRLPVRARLSLFAQVADAVHYAHQRLVVHRDLKPSNILVTADGQAKLLDFGIAKLLGGDADDAAHTRVGVRPLTPQYASPEQLRGEPVTTASDIYQLGILLHVLLVGARPGDGSSAANMTGGTAIGEFARPSARVRRAVRPRRAAHGPRTGDAAAAHAEAVVELRGTTPDKLRRALRGDLDTIVLKALRTEPEQRYESARAMAADVRRHLDGLPIAARPASLRYSFGRYVARHRWFGPVAALLVLALIVFGGARVRHERQLELERNEARAQAERADQLKGFLIGLFGSADPWAPADPERGRAITVVEALALGADRARTELADRPILQADLLSTIARVYESLDQRAPALALLDEVVELRQQQDSVRSREYLDEVGRRAAMLDVTGQADSAAALFRYLLALERELHGFDHPQLANALVSYSNSLAREGDHEGAAESRLEAIRILRAGSSPAMRKRLADVLSLIADTYRELQQPDEAENAASEAVEIQRELYGDEHASTAAARVHLAQVEHSRGRLDEAARLYREALPVLEGKLGAEHFITINSWNNLGIVLMEMEDFAGAEEAHRRILTKRRVLSGGEDNADVAASLQNLAVTLVRQRRYAEAESLTVRARDIYDSVLPAGHALRAFPLLTLSEIRLLRGDGQAAEAAARAAVELLRTALPAAHYATAAAECRLGAAIAHQTRYHIAEPLLRAAYERLDQNEQTPVRLIRECAAVLARLYDAVGRADEAADYRETGRR